MSRMKIPCLRLLTLLLPMAAHAAVIVDEFPTGRIYSSVNGDGVPVFTDIEPDELRVLPVGSPSVTTPVLLPHAKVVNVNVAAVRHMARPGFAAHEPPPLLPPNQDVEDIPAEMRDGGPPPLDH